MTTIAKVWKILLMFLKISGEKKKRLEKLEIYKTVFNTLIYIDYLIFLKG